MRLENPQSVHGAAPGWPLNKVIAALEADGRLIEEHRIWDALLEQYRPGDRDRLQAIKTRCPGPGHEVGDRDLVFVETPSGRVWSFCFAECPQAEIREYFGLTWKDLQRGPHGRYLPRRDRPRPKTSPTILQPESVS